MESSTQQAFSPSRTFREDVPQQHGSNANPNSYPFVVQQQAQHPNVPWSGYQGSTEKARDYLPWPIANLIFGLLIVGIGALVCSIKVRKYNRTGQIDKARDLSKWTLGINAVGTVLAVALWGYIIYAIVNAVKTIDKYSVSSHSYYG